MADNIIKIARDARAQGWDVSRTNNGHWRFIPPDKTKPIVISSGTPGDHRARANFMSQMYRSGFLDEEEAQTVEGEAKIEVQAAAPVATEAAAPPAKRGDYQPRGSTKRMVIDAYQLRPTHQMSFADLSLILKAKHTKLATSSIHNAVAQLVKAGSLVRLERGFYKLAPPPKTGVMPVTAEAHQRAAHPAGEVTGVVSVDGRLKKLDAALVALADVEKVIRDTRAELHELVEFRRKLKEML